MKGKLKLLSFDFSTIDSTTHSQNRPERFRYKKTELFVLVGNYPDSDMTDNIYTSKKDAENDLAILSKTPCSNYEIMNIEDCISKSYEDGGASEFYSSLY